jgi:uncharacterized protein YjcR
MRQLTTEEHARRLALYRAGCNDWEIARQHGVLPLTITRWRHRNKLSAHEAKSGLQQRVFTMLNKGLSLEYIVAIEGISRDQARAIRNRWRDPKKYRELDRTSQRRRLDHHRALIRGDAS